MIKNKRRSGLTMLELLVSVPTATVLIASMAMCVTMMMRAKFYDAACGNNEI